MPIAFGGPTLTRIRNRATGLCISLLVAVTSGTAFAAGAANVTAERLLHADTEPSQWMTYGGDYNEQRYSRLTKINKDNVKQLGLKWFSDYDTNLSQDG